MAQGHYQTLGDFLKGIRQALRDEFGEELADQDFKFNFDEDAKRVTITIKEWSCLTLNPWMTNLLHSGNSGMYGIAKRRFAEWNDDFSLLGDDEYAEADGKKPTKEMIDAVITDTPFFTYTVGEPSDKVVSWARIALGLSDHLHLFGCGGVSSGGGCPGQFAARHRTQGKSRRRDQ